MIRNGNSRALFALAAALLARYSLGSGAAVHADEATIGYLAFTNAVQPKNVDVEHGKTCQQLFDEGVIVDPSQTPTAGQDKSFINCWSLSNKSKRPAINSATTEDGMKALLSFVGVNRLDPDVIKKNVSELPVTIGEVGNKKEDNCDHLGVLIKYLSVGQVKSMNSACMTRALGFAINNGHLRTEESDIDYLRSYFTKSPKSLLDVKRGESAIKLNTVSITLMADLLKAKGFCKELGHEHVKELADGDYASKVDSNCVALFKKEVWASDPNLNSDPNAEPVVQRFNSDFFSKVPTSVEIHAGWFSGATKEQMQKFQEKLDKRCANIKFEKLTEGASGVEPSCFANRIAIGTSLDLPAVTQEFNVWESFPANIFEDLAATKKPKKVLLGKIPVDHWKSMQTEQINVLVKSDPGFCVGLPESAITDHEQLVITAECFAKLTNDVQSKALQTLDNVPQEILEHVSNTQIGSWNVIDAESQESFEKLLAILAIKNKSLIRPIYEGMKKNKSGSNLCKGAVNDLTRLAEKGAQLLEVLDEECFRRFGQELKPELVEEHPALAVYLSLQVIEKKYNFKELSEAEFKTITDKRGPFCKGAHSNLINDIPKERWANVSDGCVENFKTPEGVSIEVYNNVPVSIFGNINATMARKLKLNELSPERYAALSSNLTTDTYPGSLTGEEVGKLSVDIIKILPASFYGKIEASAYAGFTGEQIAAIPGPSMVEMTLDQVKSMCCLEKLTADQVTHIGASHAGDETKDPILALKDIVGKLSAEAQAAYKTRSSGAPALTTSSFILLVSIVVSVVFGFF